MPNKKSIISESKLRATTESEVASRASASTDNEKSLLDGWRWLKLTDVCEVVTGKWDANHATSSGRFRFFTCAYDFSFCDTSRFSGECLILPGNGANVGEVFYYNGEFDAYQRTYVIQNIKVVPKYLYYHLKLNWKKGTDAKQYGSATNYIRIGNFQDYKLSVPSTEYQHAIVSKIEELLSELDKGKQQLEAAQQQLKTYRQAVLKWAFEGRLTNENVKEGELPEGWKADTIKDVCNVKVGIVVKPTNFYSKSGKGIEAFRSANVREFRVNNEDWVYFTKEANDLNKRTQISSGDVLLVRSGYPGTSCVVPEKYEGCNAIDILIATPNRKKMLPEFLCAFNNSPLGKGHFKSKSRGVAQKHLNVGEYSKLTISYPSIEEQTRIVQEIESRLSVCDKMEETITISLAQAETLRQSILKKAFEGKLV